MMIIILFLIHAVISWGYFFFTSRRGFLGRCLCETLVIFLMPGFGLVLVTAFLLAERYVKKAPRTSFGFEDLERDYSIVLENQTTALLPLNEALLLEDQRKRRKLVRAAMCRTPAEKLDDLQAAFQDTDPATAAYAAAVLSELKRKQDQELRQLEEELELDPQNPLLMRKYSDTLAGYLQNRLLDIYERFALEEKFTVVLGRMLSGEHSEKDDYVRKINVEIDRIKYIKAEEYCREFIERYPGEEEPYLMYIKLYYHKKEYDRLLEKVRELQEAEINLSGKALEIVKYWDVGI